jgi:ferric-dicitrate binding protein FerR (iron transport regulator)
MHFQSIEEVLADENFLAWYFKSDKTKAHFWELQLLQHPEWSPIVTESIEWLRQKQVKEKDVPPEQIAAAEARLQRQLLAAPVVEMPARKRGWWKIAAAAAVLIIAGLSYWSVSNNASDKTILGSTYGSISDYQLPDGSQVILNANSHISMNKEWKSSGVREVWIDGEAFFRVQKTPQKSKFIVHTNGMDIIVTGTQFNVINRDDEISVLLTEGSITVKTPNGKEAHLKPGDFVKVENNTVAKKEVSAEKVLAWKQAKLVFDNTSMAEVATIIERYYGVKVVFADSDISEKRIGAGVMPNDNLDVLIKSLEATGNFVIKKVDNEIVISNPSL